ncbi:PIR protein [Plasmodium sp.]|nr:PIR protein [Plasmodium sp.]
MKAIMQNFGRETSQRFHEYNERMQEKRKKCKEQCDEDIQKIILKDKLEKQMEEHFSALEANRDTNDIPKCVCEKSFEDKMEKTCLRCTKNLGGIVAPSSGVLGGIGEFGLSVWKPAALAAANEFAEKAGAAAGVAAGEAVGKNAVILALKHFKVHTLFPKIYNDFVKTTHYADIKKFSGAIVSEHTRICQSLDNNFIINPTCETFEFNIGMRMAGSNIIDPVGQVVPEALESVVEQIKGVADTEAARVTAAKTAEFKIANVGAVESTYGSCQTAIIASIVAIVVIVIIMVIIYLILRYQRKKKMKKKLQYIKLLEE